MDGIMVKDTVVVDWVAVAGRGGAADWTMVGGMVASESGAAYGEEEPRVHDSGRTGVPAETSAGTRRPGSGGPRSIRGRGRWQVREAEPPAYDGEAPNPDSDPEPVPGPPAPEPAPAPDDPATHQDRIVTLEDRMAEMAGHRHAHDYRFLVLVAEYDRLEGWKLAGHRSCAHAIHFNTGFALGACREKVRAARALERMPVTSRSMARGELSFSKVRALTRVVDDLHRERPEDANKTEEEKAKAREEREAHLVEYARQGTTAEVERFIRSWRKLDRHGEEEAERRRHRSRYLWVRPDDEGMYRIRGRLDPEVGAMVMRAIEAAMDAVHARADEEGAGSDASSTDWAPEGGPRGPKRRTITARQKRADALGLLAEQALAVGFRGAWDAGSEGAEDIPAETDERDCSQDVAAAGVPAETDGPERDEGEATADVSAETRHSDEGDDGASGASPCGCHTRFHGTRAERYQVFLHVDHETLMAEGEPGRSHLEDGTRVAAETARRLTCDASVVGVIEARRGAVGDETSVAGTGSAPSDALARGAGAARPTPRILDIGRKTRTIPPALRRALYLRDGGCRFPGCGVRFTEGHHVEHWALGGRTELANLISLCRFHHRAVHEEGFEVRRTRSGDFRFFDRKGWPLPQRPRTTGVGRVGESPDRPSQTLEQTNRERGIDPQWHTAAARFSGNVDDPANGELRDLMFRAMDALDPVGGEPDARAGASEPADYGPDRTGEESNSREGTTDELEEAVRPAEEEPGSKRETLGRAEERDSPDGR